MSVFLCVDFAVAERQSSPQCGAAVTLKDVLHSDRGTKKKACGLEKVYLLFFGQFSVFGTAINDNFAGSIRR